MMSSVLISVRTGCRLSRRHVSSAKRLLVRFSSSVPRARHKLEDKDVSFIRNIGIMAHIDAGKTTTTERMLYYSGFTRHIGDVDDGDTVMDYMEQERNRGITITAAAITFAWNKHRINLIDTPGHVDFTIEVERSLRVLDGAVAILDAAAGVEAQTMTVWRQAEHYNVPRIVYLNKMDKTGADFLLSIRSLRDKLQATPLITQLPIGQGSNFEGVVDVVRMKQLIWGKRDYGRKYTVQDLSIDDGQLWNDTVDARTELIGFLADRDDVIASHVLNDVDILKIPSCDIQNALRVATLTHQGVPVLCGSSFKNRGVQPLLDAIVAYLPSPADVHYDFVQHYQDSFCALAFKITHDQQRGALTFLRVYSGELNAGATVYNVNRECTEKTSRLLQIYADDMKEVQIATAGSIVALAGLKQTVTGDTIVDSLTSANAAKKRATLHQSKAQGSDSDEDHNALPVLAGLEVPDPVFFCSIEPPSLAYEKDLNRALECLVREDPSLRVSMDEETGQTIVSGMGELHLEVVQDRILKEYGVEADLGALQIAYRETIQQLAEEESELNTTLGARQHHVKVSMSVRPNPGGGIQKQMEMVPDKTSDMVARLRRHHLAAIHTGLRSGLARGPVLGYQVTDVEVRLHNIAVGPGTSMAMVSAAVTKATQNVLKQARPVLTEPMMRLEIHSAGQYRSAVFADLSQRRSNIVDISSEGDVCTIKALTPLSEMMGYSTRLRTITSGMASVHMELEAYEIMSERNQAKAIQKVTGFYPS